MEGTSGELVFWFGDIRGFSTYTVRHGDEAALRLVQIFQGLLDKQLSSLALQPRLRKSYGDGVMLALHDTQGALHLSIALQEAILRHNVTTSVLLWVGVGLCVGTARWLGEEPIGQAVNLAKRLAEAARGGQILLSEELAACLDQTSWCLAPHEYELKGFGRVRAFEVLQPGRVAQLDFHLKEIALVGRWWKLRGDFEISLILSEDRRLKLEFNKEFVARLEQLPQRLERFWFSRPLGVQLRRLLTHAPLGLGRERLLEELDLYVDQRRGYLALAPRPPRLVGGALRFPLAACSALQLERFLKLFHRLRQGTSQ